MKTATVRDLRTRFPVVQGWLADAGEVVITKSGKPIAILKPATRTSKKSLSSVFSKRFANPISRSKKQTDIAQMLITDRGT